MSGTADIRCQTMRIKFKQNSGHNTLELTSADVGGTSYLEAARMADELIIRYWRVRQVGEAGAGTRVIQEVLVFNFESIFSYTCEQVTV